MKESIRNFRKGKKAFVACVLGLAVLSVGNPTGTSRVAGSGSSFDSVELRRR